MSDLLVMNGENVQSALAGRYTSVLDVVEAAYKAYSPANSNLPFSSFLRFPKEPRNRIIALPAFLGPPFDCAGVKWISSFPDNVASGLPRASAILILNSLTTGQPMLVCDGYMISAWRTAASAAVAARHVIKNGAIRKLGFIGCGPINREVFRFLSLALGTPEFVQCYDTDRDRASSFIKDLHAMSSAQNIHIMNGKDEVLSACDVISIATTASTPHIDDLGICPYGATILHLSVRDLSAQAILSADNIVDDSEHACREGTSLELASVTSGNRSFIRGTITDLVTHRISGRDTSKHVTVLTPFGIGILDIAVGNLIYEAARAKSLGTNLQNFF